jgi:ABC-type multidrug transport system ATPase subunit
MNLACSEDDIIVAVMGVTGAGKSTFISLLSDEEIEIGHGMESCA